MDLCQDGEKHYRLAAWIGGLKAALSMVLMLDEKNSAQLLSSNQYFYSRLFYLIYVDSMNSHLDVFKFTHCRTKSS